MKVASASKGRNDCVVSHHVEYEIQDDRVCANLNDIIRKDQTKGLMECL